MGRLPRGTYAHLNPPPNASNTPHTCPRIVMLNCALYISQLGNFMKEMNNNRWKRDGILN